MRRTSIVVPPSATLDERIGVLFPPGAIYRCEPEAMGTLVERRMRQMSSDIRSKPDWVEMINDTNTRASWAAEAKAMDLTDVEFAYVVDELAYYASLQSPGSSVRLSAADGVWFSDTLIDAETANQLKDYAAILESVPNRQKDWYPNDRSRILNLIDPSLYPLTYSRSKLCHQTSMSPQGALKIEDKGEFPGSLDGWRKALNVNEDGKSDYYLPTGVLGYGCYFSDMFCWLPSEFCVNDDGAVTVESYINNLHPVRHAALYPIIASVFAKFLPLLEHVVTDLVHPRQQRVKPDCYRYYTSDEPMPEYSDYEEVRDWKRAATFVHPQPEPFVAPARPVDSYNLRGRRLQAIVKMTNIELNSKRPIYGGNDWCVVGLANERIIATGLYFYDVANIAPSSLRFREAICAWDFSVEQFDIDSVVNAYGMDRSHLMEGDLISQELGSVGINDGLCLVFPNILQHKMPELKLVDKKKSGHCKILAFYFVDPSTRIPSTEIVPPQQQDWCFEDALMSEPFCSLPQLVVDGIMDKVDFPISFKEAKKLRLQVCQEDSNADTSFDFFEPHVYFSA
ncbi:hypothetical protein H4S07_002220 [Coemansia furcata]|uniref:Uncharacterized protein n=1 Tax=Coemansia furcata TaxID=417177 RepID=A0ACC1LLK7_9FUNG|nr:hypothetical protein H4S07_002220 [Coemansia furcata]